jgi:hypothetical protein
VKTARSKGVRPRWCIIHGTQPPPGRTPTASPCERLIIVFDVWPQWCAVLGVEWVHNRVILPHEQRCHDHMATVQPNRPRRKITPDRYHCQQCKVSYAEPSHQRQPRHDPKDTVYPPPTGGSFVSCTECWWTMTSSKQCFYHNAYITVSSARTNSGVMTIWPRSGIIGTPPPPPKKHPQVEVPRAAPCAGGR